jgi:hypothetical protein
LFGCFEASARRLSSHDSRTFRRCTHPHHNTIEEIPMANTIDEIPIANTIDSEHESNEYEQDEDPNHLITDWFLDSGANAHFCNDRTVFIKYKPICEQHTAKVAGSNQHLPIHGIQPAHGAKTTQKPA